jgi:hypothetical protein
MNLRKHRRDALSLLAAPSGAMVRVWVKRTKPWFVGTLVVSMGVTKSGLQVSADVPDGVQLKMGEADFSVAG